MAHDDGPKGSDKMSDQEQKQEQTNITPQPDAENKKQSGELSEEELKKATGGVRKSGGDGTTGGQIYLRF
jgi:hypothetical protein